MWIGYAQKKATFYDWKLDVGTGVRNYQVRATDTRGNVTLSAIQTITLMPR